jgi:hypothetical protein
LVSLRDDSRITSAIVILRGRLSLGVLQWMGMNSRWRFGW